MQFIAGSKSKGVALDCKHGGLLEQESSQPVAEGVQGAPGDGDTGAITCNRESASAFYEKQMLNHLNSNMRDFISKQEMVFIATADSKGECDCSFRAGKSGFIRVLSEKTIAYPEYRGNGVMASLGNILENQNIGMTFIDFFENTIGLHVNGTAEIIEHEEFLKTINLDKNPTLRNFS